MRAGKLALFVEIELRCSSKGVFSTCLVSVGEDNILPKAFIKRADAIRPYDNSIEFEIKTGN